MSERKRDWAFAIFISFVICISPALASAAYRWALASFRPSPTPTPSVTPQLRMPYALKWNLHWYYTDIVTLESGAVINARNGSAFFILEINVTNVGSNEVAVASHYFSGELKSKRHIGTYVFTDYVYEELKRDQWTSFRIIFEVPLDDKLAKVYYDPPAVSMHLYDQSRIWIIEE